jgi:hypothetical protein
MRRAPTEPPPPTQTPPPRAAPLPFATPGAAVGAPRGWALRTSAYYEVSLLTHPPEFGGVCIGLVDDAAALAIGTLADLTTPPASALPNQPPPNAHAPHHAAQPPPFAANGAPPPDAVQPPPLTAAAAAAIAHEAAAALLGSGPRLTYSALSSRAIQCLPSPPTPSRALFSLTALDHCECDRHRTRWRFSHAPRGDRRGKRHRGRGTRDVLVGPRRRTASSPQAQTSTESDERWRRQQRRRR